MSGRFNRQGSEEAVAERHKRCLDSLAHRLDQANSRFSFKRPDFAKRYKEGNLGLYVQGRSNFGCGDFHIVVSTGELEVGFRHGRLPADNGTKSFIGLDQVIAGDVADHVLAASGPEGEKVSSVRFDALHLLTGELKFGRLQQGAVLVPIVELVGEPEVAPTPARISLCRIKELYDRPGEMFFLTGEGAFKFIEIIPARELDGSDSGPLRVESRISDGQHLIERRSAVVDRVSGERFHIKGDAIGDYAPDKLVPLTIRLGFDSIGVGSQELADCGIEILDMGFGPLNLGERWV